MNNLAASPIQVKPLEIIALSSEANHHDHNHNQLVIGLKGRSEFNIEGSEDLILPGQGCAIVASSDHVFSGNAMSQLLILNLPNENILELHDRQRIDLLFSNNAFFQLNNNLQQLIYLLSLEIQNDPNNVALSHACNNTLIALLQCHINGNKPSQQRIDMQRIDAFITANIRNKITITQLAGCAFLCESQFYAIFKKQISITPHQYVLQKRFNTAKELLETSTLSLSQISDAVGFSNQSSFTHTFTKMQGISPSKYRR